MIPKRTDANQQEVMDALREIGATVQDLHIVGDGCPDLLVGYRGINFAVEVKHLNGDLNEREWDWHVNWRGQVATVWNVEQAIELISERTE